ncbi:hypothetical protein GCM10027605_36060 [Micromonospora zhanjiangensis]
MPASGPAALASPAAGRFRLSDMTDDGSGELLTIGELARRTGLPVRTIRYWSDLGSCHRWTAAVAATGGTTTRRWPGWS